VTSFVVLAATLAFVSGCGSPHHTTDAGTDAGLLPEADLTVVATVDQATPPQGAITYRVTLTNAGPNPATGVEVKDLLPAGVTFQTGVPSQGTYNSTTGKWTIGNLPASASTTLALQGIIVAWGVLANVAQVTHLDQLDVNSFNDAACATAIPLESDLQVAVRTSNPAPGAGVSVTYTVTATNNGPDPASAVTIQDLLPPSVTFVSALTSQGSYNSTSGLWTVGTLAAGAAPTLALTGTASGATAIDIAQGYSVGQVDQNPNNNADTTGALVADAELQVSLTSSSLHPNVGDTITLATRIINSGPASATSVAVGDLLPAGLTFVSATPTQGSYDSNTGTWTVGTVTAAATATLPVQAKVTSTSATTSTATITAGAGNDPVSANNSASLTVVPILSDLRLSVSADEPTPAVGANVTFLVGLGNVGPDKATNVQVMSLLPAGLTFVSATASQGTYSPSSGTWQVGTVTTGVFPTLTLQATVANAGTFTNTATISHADQTDPDLTNNSGSSSVTSQ
jgi:uncharacterized repeat protein (TIGR01451 family)